MKRALVYSIDLLACQWVLVGWHIPCWLGGRLALNSLGPAPGRSQPEPRSWLLALCTHQLELDGRLSSLPDVADSGVPLFIRFTWMLALSGQRAPFAHSDSSGKGASLVPIVHPTTSGPNPHPLPLTHSVDTMPNWKSLFQTTNYKRLIITWINLAWGEHLKLHPCWILIDRQKIAGTKHFQKGGIVSIFGLQKKRTAQSRLF